MQCTNCHEIIEPGATFCGNCGQPVQPVPPGSQAPQPKQSLPPLYPMPPMPSPQQQAPQQPLQQLPPQPQPQQQPQFFAAPPSVQNVPNYAVATPEQHRGGTTAILSVISGVIGIAGSFVFPYIGFGFGILGLILGTLSRRVAKRPLALVGLGLATLALCAGVVTLVISIQHKTTAKTPVQKSSIPATTTSQLTTPCYSFNLIDRFNISNKAGTCDSDIFNNSTFATSTNVYKIVSTNSGSNDGAYFNQKAKQAIDTELASSYSSYTVTKEEPSSFAGSVDYIAYFNDPKLDIAAVEAAILHPTKHGENVFIITHAVNGSSTNLQSLEAQWQWK